MRNRFLVSPWYLPIAFLVAALFMLLACSGGTTQVIKDYGKRVEDCAMPAIARLSTCVVAHDNNCVVAAMFELVTCVMSNSPTPLSGHPELPISPDAISPRVEQVPHEQVPHANL